MVKTWFIQTIPDKIFGTKLEKSIKVNRTRKLFLLYDFLKSFVLSRFATRETAPIENLLY